MHEDHNVDNIRNGEACFGVPMNAIKNAYPGMDPDFLRVRPGKAMSSYDCKPVGVKNEDLPVEMFLPEELIAGSRPTSTSYGLENWAIFRSESDALDARRSALETKISEHRKQAAALWQLLYPDSEGWLGELDGLLKRFCKETMVHGEKDCENSCEDCPLNQVLAMLEGRLGKDAGMD